MQIFYNFFLKILMIDYGELLRAKGAKLSREFAYFYYIIENEPVTVKSVADTHRLNAPSLGKAYKERLSDYPAWKQKAHSTD